MCVFSHSFMLIHYTAYRQSEMNEAISGKMTNILDTAKAHSFNCFSHGMVAIRLHFQVENQRKKCLKRLITDPIWWPDLVID